MGRIQTIIWDLDGVLVDSKEWHFEALNQALQIFGYSIPRLEHSISYDGLPTRIKLKLLTTKQGLPTTLYPIILELKQRFTMQLISGNCRPNNIHLSTLTRLKQEGFRMSVASNAIRRSVDLMLKHIGVNPFIEFSLSNENVSKPKPHPEIYLKAIGQMHCQPKNCLVVEDNGYGIQAAIAAGAHVFRVDSLEDVNYERVKDFINQIESNDGGDQ
jgi:beta-phosphoglucomutase